MRQMSSEIRLQRDVCRFLRDFLITNRLPVVSVLPLEFVEPQKDFAKAGVRKLGPCFAISFSAARRTQEENKGLLVV